MNSTYEKLKRIKHWYQTIKPIKKILQNWWPILFISKSGFKSSAYCPYFSDNCSMAL